MRQRPQSNDSSQASEALADIALNSLGLILIVLMSYMLTFHQATSELMAMQEAATPEGAAQKVQENRQLKQQVKALEKELESTSKQDEVSGLWRFRIHVAKLVGSNARVESADFVVDYFVWLRIKGNSVHGTLFGVKEHTEVPLNSGSYAEITGTYRDGILTAELAYPRSLGAEVLRATRQGEKWVGDLSSGFVQAGAGYRNYAGKAQGTRLNESVFAK